MIDCQAMNRQLYAKPNVAGASNGKAAVAVIALSTGSLYPLREAPRGIGRWENRTEYNILFARAALKLGYVRDKRNKQGWRKIP